MIDLPVAMLNGQERRRASSAQSGLFLLAACVAAGCRPAAPPATPTPPPSAAPSGNSSETKAPSNAPPIRLGMAAKDLRAQPNLTTKATTIREGGRSFPAIHVSKFGLPLFIAETRDGKVVRALIVSERYRTARGAHVGSAARELERLFGPGKLEASGPDACAEFAKAPGLSFCFRGAASTKDWAALAQANPRVRRIIVEDTAELSALDGPAPVGGGVPGKRGK